MNEDQQKQLLSEILGALARTQSLIERYELREIGEAVLNSPRTLNFQVVMNKLERFK